MGEFAKNYDLLISAFQFLLQTFHHPSFHLIFVVYGASAEELRVSVPRENQVDVLALGTSFFVTIGRIGTIIQNQDYVAKMFCGAVKEAKHREFSGSRELLQVKEAIGKRSIVGCCNHIDLIFEKCLSEYDIETALFYGNIRFMEKASLTDTLTAELKTDSNLYLEYISSKLFVKFISDLKAVQEGFRDRAQLCSNSCLEEFDANFAGKLEALGEKLVEKVVSSVREGNSLTWPSIRKMVQKAVKEDLPRCSAELVAIGIEKENLNAKLLNLKAYFSEVVDHQVRIEA
ncbi:hypothetical protein M9H77_15352 [Catharanthus roseus]|uniref:Uncharacterized protein n=1 Tax=Catharanthus roseus TaxID=4058 RepID=A0ACC0AX90_CATRO|nr:hypothetical protein M9H77_15352 [Catharanthus roseus]